MADILETAAYGGAGWSPRTASLRQEIGQIWGSCGVASEWSPLKAVLLHRPGQELEDLTDPDTAQMFAPLDADRVRRQHDALAQAYRDAGVAVHYVGPVACGEPVLSSVLSLPKGEAEGHRRTKTPPPNLMFVADLMFMTPEGVILGRPASTVRAGEEGFVARRLAELGVPILRSVRGRGTFEGADALWIDPQTVLLATGLRTNAEGAAQVASLLREMGVVVVSVGLPYGAMHLMGQLRFADRDLAIGWPGRVPYAAVEALRAHGYTVLLLPDEGEARRGMALNFVTLGPRRILMAAGNPITQAFYQDAGIACQTVEVDEILKAAGGIGCMTGILERSVRDDPG
jgi:arginine deiminase